MAKAHKMTAVSLWIGGKQIPIKNQYCRVRYTLEYSNKEYEGAISKDYTNTFDLQMLISQLIEAGKNTFTIKWQKILSEMGDEKASKWNHEVVTYADLFPGKKAAKPMTKSEIMAKLANGASNDEIDDLIKELEAMKKAEDETVTEE
jgi:hypothetical protein